MTESQLRAIAEKRAVDHLKQEYPHLASDPYFHKPENSKTIQAHLAGAELFLQPLLEALESLESRSKCHYECDDGWYSCPLAENYIEASNTGIPGKCNCGAGDFAEVIAKIEKLLGVSSQP